MYSIKRVYETPDPAEGTRVLVDRLWPRGLTRQRARVDVWLKDVAPSPELRTWWNHDPERFAEFAERYRAELADAQHRDALDRLTELEAREGAVTLLFAAKDAEVNHAVVLLELLRADGAR